MASVECVDLTRVFELGDGSEEVAVDSINATINEGDFTTIVGPSGCGKTTFLRMIAGLETPTSGEILFDGEAVTDVQPQNRGISMVFQDIALFPFKTVRSNIEYGLKYSDIDSEEVSELVQEMSEMVGIEELLDKKPPQLSGGQQQRAALARALIRDPEVFLLDEPLSDLDAKLKAQMRTELKELHNELPKTTIYVTHDQQEAMTLSDEVIVMNDGRIMQKAPPYEIYNEPENTFVAQFIGSPSINLFSARFDGTDLISESLEQSITADETVRDELSEGDEVQLGIRPSEISIADGDDETMLTANANVYEELGDETILHLEVEETDEEMRIVVPPTLVPDIGEQFDLTFDREHVHVFDATDGSVITNGIKPLAAPE
jgi:multiple sugar transport system ATP-binding protein